MRRPGRPCDVTVRSVTMDDEQRILLRKAVEAFRGKDLVIERGPDGKATIRFVEKSQPPLERTCSFCGKPQSEVAKLIAGPEAYICDGCVLLCVAILDDEEPV